MRKNINFQTKDFSIDIYHSSSACEPCLWISFTSSEEMKKEKDRKYTAIHIDKNQAAMIIDVMRSFQKHQRGNDFRITGTYGETVTIEQIAKEDDFNDLMISTVFHIVVNRDSSIEKHAVSFSENQANLFFYGLSDLIDDIT